MSVFHFKRFSIQQDHCAMKVGTDGVLLGAWISVMDRQRCLDIGAGSGLISLMLAQRNPDLQIMAIEIDEPAASQCAENMKNSPWSERMQTKCMSFQDFSTSDESKWDLIVCNPPYFQTGLKSGSDQRNLARHAVSLDGSVLFGGAAKVADVPGILGIIIPFDVACLYEGIATRYGWHLLKRKAVITAIGKKPSRILLEFSRIQSGIQEENSIVVEIGGRNIWSEEYKLLTKDFYLAF